MTQWKGCVHSSPAVGLCPSISKAWLQLSLPQRGTCQHRYLLTAGAEVRCASAPWKEPALLLGNLSSRPCCGSRVCELPAGDGLCAGQPGRAPAPQPAQRSGLPRARSRRRHRAGRVPAHLRAAPTPYGERCVGFGALHRIPLSARGRRRSPHPGDPLVAPLVALPRSRGRYPIPGRASPLPGGSESRLPRAGQPRVPGWPRLGTYLCRGITSHAMLAMEPLPARPPAAPLAAPAAPPAPGRGERPAPGRGQGAAGPGLAAGEGPPQRREPRPGPLAATPATAPGPARHGPWPCPPHRARQAQVNQRRLLMSGWFRARQRCYKLTANGSFQQKGPTRSCASLSVTVTHRPSFWTRPGCQVVSPELHPRSGKGRRGAPGTQTPAKLHDTLAGLLWLCPLTLYHRCLAGLAQPLHLIPSRCSRYHRRLNGLCCSWPPSPNLLQRKLFFP